MFSYYLKLGWLSIRRNPLLSTLMVVAIAVGIGASMTIITVNHVMSGNPIPQKSDQLFYVQLDSFDPNNEDDDVIFHFLQVQKQELTKLVKLIQDDQMTVQSIRKHLSLT